MWVIVIAALAVVVVKTDALGTVRRIYDELTATPCCDACADGKPCDGASSSGSGATPGAYDATTTAPPADQKPPGSAFEDIEPTEARWDADEAASMNVRAVEGDAWERPLSGVGMELGKW